jgi:hypothetical protein
VAASVAVVSVFVLVYIFLLPVVVYSYLVQQVDLSNVINNSNTGESIGEQRREVKMRLAKYNKFINGIKLVYDQAGVVPKIDELVTNLGDIGGVHLTRVEMRYQDGEHIINLAGNTNSRETMVSVQDQLSDYRDMELVNFPVSNFAPRDGVYNLTAEMRSLPNNSTNNE